MRRPESPRRQNREENVDNVKETAINPAAAAEGAPLTPRPAAASSGQAGGNAPQESRAAKQTEQPQAKKAACNSFFGDSLLFRHVAKTQADLVPELAELGAWAAGADAQEKARAIHIFPPRLTGIPAGAGAAEAAQLVLHPAYHGLLTRARHAGLASLSPAGGGSAAGNARQARACRLFLLSQVDCAPLQDMTHSAAAALALTAAPLLKQALDPLLSNRIHDPSRRFFAEKQSIALGFVWEDEAEFACRAAPVAADEEPAAGKAFAAATGAAAGALPFYRIWGECRAALSPLSDGFIIRAAAAGGGRASAAPQFFFVPAVKAPGQGNGVEFMPFAGSQPLAAPCCGLRFNGSLALPLAGAPGQAAAAAPESARDLLLSDYIACAAGLMRAQMSRAVAQWRQSGRRLPAAAQVQAERVLADAALDAAAAQALTLRLAEAEDKAGGSSQEAAFAAVMRPALAFELWQILPQFADALARLTGASLFGQAEAGLDNRLLLPDFYAEYEEDGAAISGGFALPALLRQKLRRHGVDFFAAQQALMAALPAAMGAGAGQVLRLAAQRCNEEAGAAIFLAERLVYSNAAALFYARDCGGIATAYTESRLGGARQNGYGGLSLRHNAEFILEALYPQH